MNNKNNKDHTDHNDYKNYKIFRSISVPDSSINKNSIKFNSSSLTLRPTHYDNHKYDYHKTKFKNPFCGNCGKYGHPYKNCKEPITSVGVILVDILFNSITTKKNLVSNLTFDKDKRHKLNITTEGIKCDNIKNIQAFCALRNNIKFLMIRRKHTLGLMEFIRGRYNIENVDGINFLFQHMTAEEIAKIGSSSFDDLWKYLWSGENYNHRNEYIRSKKKFEQLQKGSDDGSYLNLNHYVDNIDPRWEHAEWGFPKGRRNYRETNFVCGIREFKEETNYEDGEFIILNKVHPIEENLIGTNGTKYKHIYYIALNNTKKEAVINFANRHQSNEIGDIGWFTYDEAIKLIRPYHLDRRKLITELYMFIINQFVDNLDIS